MMTVQSAIEKLKCFPDWNVDDGWLTDSEMHELSDIAISALEKQIAKIPNYEDDGYYNGELVYDTWICPCCEKEYEVDYEDYVYCPNCGQHIDHSTFTEDD